MTRSLWHLSVCCGLLLTLAGASYGEDLKSLVCGDVTKVVADCRFTEGPAWHPDGYLLFSDIPNSRIIRVDADGSSRDWMTDSDGANGLMCDRAGNVYACQGDAQRVARLVSGPDQKGQVAAILAGEFDGKPLNKPNDLALDGHGGLYFTDPNYRREDPTQPVEGVYYVSQEGKLTRVVADLPRPNGVLVSDDGKTLYVANINERQIVAYDIVSPGQLSAGRILFEGDQDIDGNGPDGMALDSKGNIYATYKQLVVVSRGGDLIGRVEVPEKPSNCAFGGADNSTLYITARTSLYKLPMKISGMGLQKQGPQGKTVAAADPDTRGHYVYFDDNAAEKKTEEVKLEKLTLQIPAGWVKGRPSSNLRLAQYDIPAGKAGVEAAEYVVFPPFGGSVKQNVERWIGQFDAQGRSVRIRKGTSPQGEYVIAELTGTYKKPVGPPIRRQTEDAENYAMLAIMLTVKDAGNYFIKVTGPVVVVMKAADDIRASFGGDAAKESAYEL